MADPLARLSVGDFAPAVGDAFALDAGEHGRLELRLVEAVSLVPQSLRAKAGGGREPFSLRFRGPAEPVFGQQILPLVHPRLGRLDIFVVPTGRDAAGTSYEAVFA